MSRRIVILVIFIVGLFNMVIAQQQEPVVPRTCATMEQDSINKIRYPKRKSLDEFEDQIQQRVRDIQSRQRGLGRTQALIVTIPIVVHIVHNGEAVGSGTNISKAQVQAQIDVLNEDFRKKLGTPGHNTNPVGADIEIEFCLSPVDDNGNTLTEPGIHRYNGGKSSWTREEIEGSLKANTIWNPNQLYNIWTVKFGGTSSNLLGYAQFPDDSGLSGLSETGGPVSTDGVVFKKNYFGSTDKGSFPVMQAPYNKGRTLSHETGHWLGLRHIWGDGNCADDFVADTPTQQSASSGCPVGRISCGSTNMVENYMDYTNDACMNIFTLGQKDRMQAVMELSPRRNSLIAANLCSPTVADVPTPNFTSDKVLVLRGGDVNFTDLSTNFPNEWHWTFGGGSPSASTERNPKIKYTTPGLYKVTLSAVNSIGKSDTLEVADYITVSEEGVCGTASNFDDTFTPTTLPLSNYGSYTGYLTGHNNLKTKAISEFFANKLGYEYINGVNITFTHLYTISEDASITVVLWNARGPQRSPGSVVERKTVLFKQIQEDILNNRPTTIVFDRETPVFGKPYQVGIELNYANGDTLAIQSSLDGESTNATSWIQNQAGTWSQYATAFGANIAMKIEPFTGMDLSVQVSSSKTLVYPGEEVVLNGRGATIFSWNSDDGKVENYPGPQLIIKPTQTTTILTIGSGIPLCYDSAYTTIYIRDNVLGTEPEAWASSISLYPNPGTSSFTVSLENSYTGDVQLQIQSAVGSEISGPVLRRKESRTLQVPIETSQLRSGLYLIKIRMGDRSVIKKWVKL